MEAVMQKRSNRILIVLVAAGLFAIGPRAGTAFVQKQSVPKAPPQAAGVPITTQALRQDEVKQLLLLMDTDKNGKISKQEWMTFMEAEFNRLDKNKTGELDPKELAQSRVLVRTLPNAGK